ncbi:MAG: serine/threonine protein kinase [Planctomycetota bacterium]|nr:serine/threonine protein kinase [Planctomycetota bacterium]
MVAMTGEDNRQLVNEAVNKGFLSPAQANAALKAIRHAESSGAVLVLREFLVQNKIVSPRRWEEFEKHLMAKAAKEAQNAQPAAAPAPQQALDLPKTQGELALPFDIAGYRLTEKIGQGGMGSVFKATQKAMRRTVAIKTLSPKYAIDPQYVERFRNEAKAAAALNHPNVIVPIEVGEEKGIHFISMEFIQGESLGQWMDREGRVPWKEATDIVKQIAKGLEYAHKRGVVHRDIKPDNILLDKGSGLAKIADLGLARRTAAAEGSLSQEGQAVGTPYYVAPEQARGQKDLDGRADLYSLGATFWHMLAGVPPFEGVTAAVIMTKHLTEAVPDPRSAVADLPEPLVSIIFMLMAKERDERYANATELIEDLEALEGGQPLVHARGLKKSGKERSPLAVPVLRGGAGASRLREPGVSRPAASRLRGPGMSRAASMSRMSGGSHVLSRRPKKTSGPWVVIAVCLLLLPLIGAAIYINAQEKAKPQTSVPPATPAPAAAEKTPAKSDPKADDAKTGPAAAREAAAQKELRDADDFAHAHPLPFNQDSVLGRYQRIVNEQAGTAAAGQAKTRIEDLQRAIKALQNAAGPAGDPSDSR